MTTGSPSETSTETPTEPANGDYKKRSYRPMVIMKKTNRVIYNDDEKQVIAYKML